MPIPTGFTVTGSLHSTDAKVRVSDVQQPAPHNVATSATSTFTAHTAEGPIVVAQTVGLEGPVLKADLAPTLVIAGQTVTPDPNSVVVQKWRLPSLDILVQAVAQLPSPVVGVSADQSSAPDTASLDTESSAATVTVTTVLDPTLVHVVAQNVDVDQPASGAGASAASGTAPTASSALVATAAAEGRREG